MKRPVIFFVWLAIFEAASFGLQYKYGARGVTVALGLSAALWCGLLLAIFTEAWVKFKSQLLERHVGFDVGRNVFDALNCLESAVAVTMVTNAAMFPDDFVFSKGLTLVFAMLVSQVFYLTPQLELRAAHVISEILEKKKDRSEKEEAVFKELKRVAEQHSMPVMSLHHIYVLMEIAKFILLALYSVDQLLALPPAAAAASPS